MISCKNSVKNVTSLNCILLHVITPIHTCRHVVLCRYSGLFLHTKNDLHFPSRKLDPSLKKELPAAWGLLTFLANFIPNIGGPVRNLVSPDLKWKVVFPPWKINMEHNNNNNNHRGLEDHFSFLNGWFACSMLIFQGETLFETQNLSWFEEDFDDFSIWSPESFLGVRKFGDPRCAMWTHLGFIPHTDLFFCLRWFLLFPVSFPSWTSEKRCTRCQRWSVCDVCLRNMPRNRFQCFKISNSLEVVAAFCAQFLLHFNIANFVEPIVFGQSEEFF